MKKESEKKRGKKFPGWDLILDSLNCMANPATAVASEH